MKLSRKILLACALSITFIHAASANMEHEISTQSISSSPALMNASSQSLVKYVSPAKENSQLNDQMGISRKIDKTFELPAKTKKFSKVASMIALGLMCLGVYAVIHFIRRRSNSVSD